MTQVRNTVSRHLLRQRSFAAFDTAGGHLLGQLLPYPHVSTMP